MADADDEDGEDGEDGNAVNDDGTTAGTLLVEGCEGGGGRIAPSMGSISTTTRPSERRNDDDNVTRKQRYYTSVKDRVSILESKRRRWAESESERKRANERGRVARRGTSGARAGERRRKEGRSSAIHERRRNEKSA